MVDRSEEEISRAARWSGYKEEHKELFNAIRDGINAQMDKAPLVQTEMHTKLILTRQLLNNLEKYVENIIQTGKLAQFQIDQEEKRKFWQLR